MFYFNKPDIEILSRIVSRKFNLFYGHKHVFVFGSNNEYLYTYIYGNAMDSVIRDMYYIFLISPNIFLEFDIVRRSTT